METLISLYGIGNRSIRNAILRILMKMEGGEFTSATMRTIFKKYHHVEIGTYSHGGCFMVGQFDKYTSIGRYCSIAKTARAMNRNHPLDRKSMHGYFFNASLGYVGRDDVEFIPLTIGNDVWMGHNSIVMPHVKSIGDGAVVAAGAIVNKDVPPYAVVVGNPARVVRYRFSGQVIEELIASRWWEKSIEELMPDIGEFCVPYEKEAPTREQ